MTESDNHSQSGSGPLPLLAENEHTYATALREVRKLLRDGGVPDWEASAEWLTTDALQISRTELFSRSQDVAHPDRLALLDEWVRRRLSREPVQYIVGYAEFCDLRLRVDARVLIPRQETEILVGHVVQVARQVPPPVRVLDIGTGSGCIALAIAKSVPEADVVGCDVTEEVLSVARENGESLRASVRWLKWDILNEPPSANLGRFSIIVSNPPYVPRIEAPTMMPEVVSHEPARALFVEGDALAFYRAILDASAALMLPQGYVFFEVNPDYALRIERLMRREHGFSATGTELDLAARRRIVWGRCDG